MSPSFISHLGFLREGLSLNLEINSTAWPMNRRVPVSPPPYPAITGMPDLLKWVLGMGLRSSCLLDKHFPDRAISPVSYTGLFIAFIQCLHHPSRIRMKMIQRGKKRRRGWVRGMGGEGSATNFLKHTHACVHTWVLLPLIHLTHTFKGPAYLGLTCFS